MEYKVSVCHVCQSQRYVWFKMTQQITLAKQTAIVYLLSNTNVTEHRQSGFSIVLNVNLNIKP